MLVWIHSTGVFTHFQSYMLPVLLSPFIFYLFFSIVFWEIILKWERRFPVWVYFIPQFTSDIHKI